MPFMSCSPTCPDNYNLECTVNEMGAMRLEVSDDYRYTSRIRPFFLPPGLYGIVFDSKWLSGEEKYRGYPVVYRKKSKTGKDIDLFALYNWDTGCYYFLPTGLLSKPFEGLWVTQAEHVIEKTHGELSKYLDENEYRFIQVGDNPIRDVLAGRFLDNVRFYPMVFAR